jgi:predicted enzyme related to lactoylglutathione lyase
MTKDMGFRLARIGQIAINVRDVERATAFYRDKLELKFLFAAGNMAFFDCAGIRLLLGLAEKPEDHHPSSILYFHVDDIHAAHESMKSRGVEFKQKPHFVANMGKYDLWIGFFRDSEENILGIMAEVAN